MPTLTLDPTFSGTVLETSDAWIDELAATVSLDDFSTQTVALDFTTATSFLGDAVFENVVIESITSDGRLSLQQTLKAHQMLFTDGATVASDDLAQSFHIRTATIGSLGTITFDGYNRFQSVVFNNAEFTGLSAVPLVVNLTQSDGIERRPDFATVQFYGELNGDSFTEIDLFGSQLWGTINAHGGMYIGYVQFEGVINLFDEDALNNRIGISNIKSTDVLSTQLVIQGDGENNTIQDNATLNVIGRIDMGNGWDTVVINGSVDGDIALGQGNDMLTLTGSVTSKITAGKGNDIIDLSSATNAGITVFGGAGADSITGTATDDTLVGDGGNDTITGGGGRDTLVGRKGADTFVFDTGDSTNAARDTIRDFKSAQGDKIDLSSVAIAFNDTGAFSNTAGEVIAIGKYVRVDEDGDGVADMVINMRSDLGLVESDFILGGVF